MIDLFAGPLSLKNIGSVGIKSVVFWESDVGSISSSISGLLDVKNMTNIVVKETSYTESNENNNMDEIIPRKTYIWTYMLGHLPKQSLFKHISDDNIVVESVNELLISLIVFVSLLLV
ncbi:hypothetical protein G9A89_009985 [Geosiphon pyriformis]|nr:hypothetical protein G9A89_009985 [Geosiphon pyriformis]